MMQSAMRIAPNSATHGRRLKLHRTRQTGEVSNTAGRPQVLRKPSIPAAGTDVALNYLNIGVGRGGAHNRAGRASYELTVAHLVNLVAAARHAATIGLPLTRMITIHWQAAGVPLSAMASATGRFTGLLAKALARHGSNTAWVWVHENGDGKGGHCHLLVHVRPVDVPIITRLQMGWLRRITGQPYRRHVIRGDAIGRKLGLDTSNPEKWARNVDTTLGYIL